MFKATVPINGSSDKIVTGYSRSCSMDFIFPLRACERERALKRVWRERIKQEKPFSELIVKDEFFELLEARHEKLRFLNLAS